MNAPFNPTLTDRELRWLRHIAVHGPQSSEFLLELCADTHSCQDTGKRTLKKLRDLGYLRLPPQQDHIAKADFNPHVYDLTRRAQMHLSGLGDPDTVPPTGHWWHAFLTASLTSAVEIEAQRKGYRYIPAHHILNRANATLAIPHGKAKLIPDQLFALNYGGKFRSFVLEVDRGTEPYASKSARKSLRRMIEVYADLTAKDAIRRHYGLKSPLLILMVFTNPTRAAKCLELVSQIASTLAPVVLVQSVKAEMPRLSTMKKLTETTWQRCKFEQFDLFV